MKKVLILYDYFTPAYKAGGITRSLTYLIQNFGKNFQFFIITSNHDLGDPSPLPTVKSDVWQSYEGKTQIIYCTPKKISAIWLYRTIKTIQPNCIYINGMYSFKFNLLPLFLRRFTFQVLTVVAPRGMLQQGALSVKPVKKQLFLKFFKTMGLHSNIRWHATDTQEVKDIQHIMGTKAKVILAPVTPDLQRIRLKFLNKEPGSLSLVTVSLITAKKNINRILMELVKFPMPLTYDIYGPVKDKEYWEQCQALINQLPGHIKVHYRGDVKPADVSATLQKYHFFILPTLGENFGHAIYEALNAGRPVIISNRTPWKRLDEKKAGWDFDLEDDHVLPFILKQCVEMDQITYNILCKRAQLVAQNFVKDSDFLKQYQHLFDA